MGSGGRAGSGGGRGGGPLFCFTTEVVTSSDRRRKRLRHAPERLTVLPSRAWVSPPMRAHPKINALESASQRTDLPAFRAGDTVRVHYKIVEGDKERIQVFQGLVIKQHRAGARSTFTVRKVSFNVGVERVFPTFSPRIDKIEIVGKGVVRRSRLFYLRELQGKAARLRDQKDM